MLGRRLPDFLIIGAPKAGTTTLAADLAAHDQVWMPRQKELGYFDVRWATEPLDAYSADFGAAPAGAITGEATPTYLHAPGALARVASAVPAARLVVVLRDPVARFWSHYWYNRAARQVEGLTPEQVFARKPHEYLEPGRYAAHLRRASDLFDAAQMHVLLLDDLIADPGETYRSVCRHLGLHDPVPVGLGRPRNSAYVVRSARLRRVMLRMHAWRRLPFGLGYRLDQWNRVPLRVPSMPESLRAAVAEAYEQDTADLEAMLGRALPWGGSARGAADTDVRS